MSLYDVAIPTLVRVLGNLRHILRKGEAYAEARKIDPTVLLGSRLAPDMHPLTRQVQMVSDSAKGGAARLAGVEPPAMPDTETSFAELYQRIDKTIDFVKSLKPDQFDGADTRIIALQFPGRALKMSGQELPGTVTFPNVFFHAVTAYNILRHNGVEIGQMDYLACGQPA